MMPKAKPGYLQGIWGMSALWDQVVDGVLISGDILDGKTAIVERILQVESTTPFCPYLLSIFEISGSLDRCHLLHELL
jgi:hypothetical protein